MPPRSSPGSGPLNFALEYACVPPLTAACCTPRAPHPRPLRVPRRHPRGCGALLPVPRAPHPGGHPRAGEGGAAAAPGGGLQHRRAHRWVGGRGIGEGAGGAGRGCGAGIPPAVVWVACRGQVVPAVHVAGGTSMQGVSGSFMYSRGAACIPFAACTVGLTWPE